MSRSSASFRPACDKADAPPPAKPPSAAPAAHAAASSSGASAVDSTERRGIKGAGWRRRPRTRDRPSRIARRPPWCRPAPAACAPAAAPPSSSLVRRCAAPVARGRQLPLSRSSRRVDARRSTAHRLRSWRRGREGGCRLGMAGWRRGGSSRPRQREGKGEKKGRSWPAPPVLPAARRRALGRVCVRCARSATHPSKKSRRRPCDACLRALADRLDALRLARAPDRAAALWHMQCPACAEHSAARPHSAA